MNRNEILAMRRERAALIEQARGVLNGATGQTLTGEQQQQYDRIMAQADSFKVRIDAEERVTAEELALTDSVREPQRPAAGISAAAGTAAFLATPEYRDAMVQWTRGGFEALTAEQRSVIAQGRVMGEGTRAPQTVTTSGGGYLIAQDFQNEIEKAELEFGSVITSGARVLSTSTGGVLMWPTVNDTSNVGELLAINTAAAEQAVAFGNVQFDAYKYSSKTVLVPFELLQDSEINIPALLGELLGERVARIQNQHLTTGTGSAQPNGMVTASTLGVTAAGTAAITADELVDLQHAVDPRYRKASKWMFEDSVLKYIKKLKDSENRYLWSSGLAVREPDTILGHPYLINQDMASMTAGSKSVIFGDFRKYVVRKVKGFELYRVADKYIESGQVGFVGFARMDADLVNAGTNPIKHLIQAAS